MGTEEITREEAVNQLRMFCGWDSLPLRLAKDMAIKALVQGFYDDQIKPVLGFWQKVYEPRQEVSYFCSVCNYHKTHGETFNYCPKCGAKMLKQ